MPVNMTTPYNVPPPALTLNSDDILAGNVLSNGDLTITGVSAPGTNSVRGTAALQSTGKYYFEGTFDGLFEGQEGNMGMGISSKDPWVFTTSPRATHATGELAFFYQPVPDEFFIRQRFSINQFGATTLISTGITNISQADPITVGVKADFDAFTYEFVSTAGTSGPYTIPSGGGSPAIFVPYIAISGVSGSICTVNFGATAYAHGLPSGYSNWTT